MERLGKFFLCRRSHWIIGLSLIALVFGTTDRFEAARGAFGHQETGDTFLFLPLVMREFQWKGAWIAGKVVDARDQDKDGQPDAIAGAQVCTQYQECASTSSEGTYQISLGDTALREVTASKTGYISLTQGIYPLTNQTVTLNFVLSPPLTDVVSRIVLTWDTTRTFPAPVPEQFLDNDLDAYLFMEHQTQNQVIYYDFKGNCTEFPNACLLYDVRKGAGPETIDISVLELGNPATIYHYAVHHANYLYSQKTMPSLAELQARVCLYFKDVSQANCYSAPQGEFQLWYLFSMNQEGTVTLKNCLTDDPPDTNDSDGIQPPVCP
jgi:hypothetical protein